MIVNFLTKPKTDNMIYSKLNIGPVYSKLSTYMYRIIDPYIDQLSLRWTFNNFEGICDLKNIQENPFQFIESDFDQWAPGTEYVQELAQRLNMPKKGRVLLNKSAPGTCSKFSKAKDLWRAYIPLTDNTGTFLVTDNKFVKLRPGSVYLADVSEDYTIVNSDNQDFIYLVFHNCMHLSKW